MRDFIKRAYDKNLIKPLEDAFCEFPIEKVAYNKKLSYFIEEDALLYTRYKRGDIIFVNKYEYSNGEDGYGHLFVILDDNMAVTIEYFAMLISSNLEKLKYKSNILLEKDYKNNLRVNSIVKSDCIYKIKDENISAKIGIVDENRIQEFEKMYNEKNS